MLQEKTLWDVGNRFRPNFQTELYYRSLIPKKPRLILLLIHGAGQHSGQFFDLGRYCLRYDIAFYAIDLRGFGQSTGPRGHIHSFYEYIEDLDKFLTVVKRTHPGDPVFLLGHSLGGTIVIRYGQEHQHEIRGAILSAPALRIRLHIPRSLYFLSYALSWGIPRVSVDLQRWRRFLAKGSLLYRIVQNDSFEKPDPWVTNRFSIRWVTELLRNGQQALSKANKFQINALFVCGTSDALIDPSTIHEFYKSLTYEDKKFTLFPDANHRLLQDDGKEIVFEHIVNWLLEHIESIY